MKVIIALLVAVLAVQYASCFNLTDIKFYTDEVYRIDWGQWSCANLTVPLMECVNQAGNFKKQLLNQSMNLSPLEDLTVDNMGSLQLQIRQAVCPLAGEVIHCIRSKVSVCPNLLAYMEQDVNITQGLGKFEEICQPYLPPKDAPFQLGLPRFDLKYMMKMIEGLRMHNWTKDGCQNLTEPLLECGKLAKFYQPQFENRGLPENQSLDQGNQAQLGQEVLKEACPATRKLRQCIMSKLSMCGKLYGNITNSQQYKAGLKNFDTMCAQHGENTCGISLQQKQMKKCGGFGDPHFKLFNTSYVSYQYQGKMTILNNSHLQITIDTESVSNTANQAGTAISGLNITYKDECAQTQLNFKPNNFPSNETYALSGSYIIYQNNSIFFPRLFTKIFIKQNRNHLSFQLVTPFAGDPGVCKDGFQAPAARILATIPTYPECDSITDPTLKDACNYDIYTTQSTDWATSSVSFVEMEAEATTEADQLAEYVDVTSSYTVFGLIPRFLLSGALLGLLTMLLLV